VLETALQRIRRSSDIRLLICDLSAPPFIDRAGSHMLHDLHEATAARDIIFHIARMAVSAIFSAPITWAKKATALAEL
jgi:hypothetical protein